MNSLNLGYQQKINNIMNDLHKQVDEIVIKALSKHGYNFVSKEQAFIDLKDRVKIVIDNENTHLEHYYLDDKKILTIDNEITTKVGEHALDISCGVKKYIIYWV